MIFLKRNKPRTSNFHIASIILILLSFADTNLSAQPFGKPAEGYRIYRQEYENSGGEKGSSVFEYDNTGQLRTGYWSLDDGSRYSWNYYEYDEAGNLVSAERDFSEGRTSYELFKYDSEGHKTEERFYRSDSIYGKALYTYENGILKSADLQNFKGWLTITIEYENNNAGIPEKGIMSVGEKIVGYINYTFDKEGSLIRETWDFNGKWSQTFSYFYEPVKEKKNFYSSPYLQVPSSQRVSHEDYSFNEESGGPSEYYYNNKGNLEKKVFTRSDGLSTSTLYFYDDEGRLIKSMREYNDGQKGEFRYSYDASQNLIGRYFYISDTLAAIESHFYDPDGRLFKTYYRNFDSWLTGTVSYSTGPGGRPEKGVFKGENGFDATLKFTYNRDGLLTELVWDFSFGKFQRYRFEYEKTKLKEASASKQ